MTAVEKLMELVDAYGAACGASAIAHAELGPDAQDDAERQEMEARVAVLAAIEAALGPEPGKPLELPR